MGTKGARLVETRIVYNFSADIRDAIQNTKLYKLEQTFERRS